MVSNNEMQMFAGISSQEFKLMCKTHKVNSWLSDSDDENNDDAKRQSNEKILEKNKPPPYKLTKSVNQIKQEQLVAAVVDNNNDNRSSTSKICRGYGEVVKDGPGGPTYKTGAVAKTKQASHLLPSPEAKKVPKPRECLTTRSGNNDFNAKTSQNGAPQSTPKLSPPLKVLVPHNFLGIQEGQNNTRAVPKKDGVGVTVSPKKNKKSKSQSCSQSTSTDTCSVLLPNRILLPNAVHGPTNSFTSEFEWPREYIKNIKKFNTIQAQSEQEIKKSGFIRTAKKAKKPKMKEQSDSKQNLFIDVNSFSLLAPSTDDENAETDDESVILECDFNDEINKPQDTAVQEKRTKKKKHRKKEKSKVRTIEKDFKDIKLHETKDQFVLRDKNCNKLTQNHREIQIPVPEYFVRRNLRIVHPQRGSQRYIPQCIEVREQLMVRRDVMHTMTEMTRRPQITSPQTPFE